MVDSLVRRHYLQRLYLFTTSDNNGTDLGIVVHLIEGRDQLVHQTGTQGVERLRTVESDESHTAVCAWTIHSGLNWGVT